MLKCSTIKCRNYDDLWAKDWLTSSGPQFKNFDITFGEAGSHQFLTRFKGTSNTNFDLYTCKTNDPLNGPMGHTPTDIDLCYARYGSELIQAYYIDSSESEIGIVGQGPVQTAPKDVQSALKMALSLYRKRLKLLKKP
jgi:hypothetical protein